MRGRRLSARDRLRLVGVSGQLARRAARAIAPDGSLLDAGELEAMGPLLAEASRLVAKHRRHAVVDELVDELAALVAAFRDVSGRL